MIRIPIFIEDQQNAALEKISKPHGRNRNPAAPISRVSKGEHIRRAIDMYLSRPDIAAALVELEKDALAASKKDGV